ncbi:MAG: DUF3298 domain-containing protein [Rudaea sp.]
MPYRPPRRFRPAFIAAVLFTLTGCGRQPAVPLSAATAAETVAVVDSGSDAGRVWSISYPSLRPQWHVLDKAIRDFAATQKKQFLDAGSDSHPPSPAYSFDLKFAVARQTADFISVLAGGNEFIGGAHAMPIVASFNLDTASDKLVGIEDLFADPSTALQALSAECRRQLEGRYEAKLRGESTSMTPQQQAVDSAYMRGWIEKGTAPTAANYRVFLVDGLETRAIGLTLIFPPYQVAAYADGQQQVEVPAKVFYAQLKPEYRDAFAIDTQADKLSGRVR